MITLDSVINALGTFLVAMIIPVMAFNFNRRCEKTIAKYEASDANSQRNVSL